MQRLFEDYMKKKKETRSNLVIYTFLFYKIQMIYRQCCQGFKKCDFELQGALE